MKLLLPFRLLACSLLLFPVVTTTRDACDSQANDFQHLNSSGLHLTLHHPRSPCSPAPLPSDLPFSAIIANDAARAARLTTSLHRDNNLSDSLAATRPIAPGSPLGVNNYVTRLGLGTPATLYAMLVDTGSSLMWLRCAPCKVPSSSCENQAGPLYNPQASSTYASVTCSAPQCGQLPAATGYNSSCSNSNICKYHAGYKDGSFSNGYLGRETMSFGPRSFPGFYYGCSQDYEGTIGRTAGIVGLGRNKLSLLYQLAPSLGFSFSYCLPTQTSSSPSIGSYNPGQYSYTPMVSFDTSHYYVTIARISVGGSPLAVSSLEYSSRLGTVMDSGSTVTSLPTAVYKALSKAVAAAMGRTPRAPPYSSLDTCFKGQASKLSVPAVDLSFAGGATLKLTAKNVLFDVDGSQTCLAFVPTDNIAIIGNTQQQTFSIVYDVNRSRIGFAAGGCS